MNTNKPITLYTWKANKLKQIDPKVIIKKMENNILGYDPEDNAKQLARLFCLSLPGNTLDVFYKAIADEILIMLNSPDNIEILKSPYDLSNRVRIAINLLAERDNK